MIQSLVTVLLCGALFIPETPQKEVLVVLTVGVIGWVVFGTAIAIAYALPSPQCQQSPGRIAGRKAPKGGLPLVVNDGMNFPHVFVPDLQKTAAWEPFASSVLSRVLVEAVSFSSANISSKAATREGKAPPKILLL